MPATVPNKFPKLTSDHKIAIIGEAPGADEELAGEPFVGTSGRILRSVLATAGLIPEALFFGNVCQTKPPFNNIDLFDFHGPEIQGGLAQLNEDLKHYNPNLVLCLGNTPLRAFHPWGTDANVGTWRGSLFKGRDYKCLSAYHPAFVLRVYNELPLLRADIQKAKRHSTSSTFEVNQRQFTTHPSLDDVRVFCNDVRTRGLPVSMDIEGYANNVGITMVGFSKSSRDAFVVPFWLNGHHYWSEADEVEVWIAVAGLLADENVPKKLQNALYEFFVLHWRHKVVVNNISEDTMLKHFELFPEMDKGLDLQASLYTDQPYYKDQRGVGGDAELVYNATDCVVTNECEAVQETMLAPLRRSKEHYRFNVELLPAINYMQLRGCRIDSTRLATHLESTQADIDRLQVELNNSVGRKINAKSNPDKQWFLYEFLGYKPYEKYGKTAKEEVLHRYYQKEKNPAVKLLIQLVGKRTRKSDIGKLTTNLDGRLRCSYNLVGTNTCRLSSSESQALEPYFTKSGLLKWEGSGTNLQNQTPELRDVFVADEGFDFWQIDLEGADGWTVSADLAALGAPTMLDDYLFGIKPALVLFVMIEEHERKGKPEAINQLSRPDLKARCDAVKAWLNKVKGTIDEHGRPADWKYLCMKRVQHGTNYDMKPAKLSATIFKDSDGLIDLSTNEASIYQYYYRLRYNPDLRRNYVVRELRDKGYIQTASGFRRKLNNIRFGQPDDATVRDALAIEPQANTTYVCNKALHALWYDTRNRTSRGSLFVEPLIQVHDALAGQWGSKYREWAIDRLKDWFRHPLIIHGIEITIPFSGGFGHDWKNTKESI